MISVRAAAVSAVRGAATWMLRQTALTPAFDGAGTGRRATGWTPSASSINAILFGSAETLRARSRDMVRKNPWASSAIGTFTANAVGTGIKPRSTHPDPEVRKAVNEAFLRWTDESDAAGVLDFYGQQASAVRAGREGGDCFGRLRFRRPEDGLSVPLQIQLLEAEQVPTHMNQLVAGGNVVRQGIEFDGLGRRVAYHMYREHPGEMTLTARGNEIVRVPGAEVLHHYEPLRPGQIRGQPVLAQALLRLYEFDQYEGNEVVRKRDASAFSGFIFETGEDAAPLAGKAGTDTDDGSPTEVAKLEPGTFQKLRPGEDIKFAAPAGMGEGYSDFMQWVLRAIAASAGVTYEQLTGDLTKVNFSSMRAGLIEFRRSVEMFQHCVFVVQFCRPVWRAWMPAAVLAGALPVSATAFRRDMATWLGVKWDPPGWQYVNPVQDIKAIVDAIRAGLMSRSEAVSQYGFDAEEIDAEIAADNKRADDLGLVLDSDPRKVSAAGLTQARAAGSALPDTDTADGESDEDTEERRSA